MESITSSDGTVLAYHRAGQGPPLLLVHGTTADHTRWQGVSPQLEQRFTAYAMDRRGRGGSSDSPEYEIQREAEDVAAVVESVGEPVSVVGHSYGAVCSLEAALLTDLIQRLVLYEPPIPTGVPMYPPGFPDQMQVLIDDGELESALELFFREVVRMPEGEFEQYRRLPMWQTRIQLAPTIPRELAIDRAYTFDPARFSDLETSVLLMLGGDSPPLFSRAVETARSALPNAEVVVLPGQQHVAMDTNPEMFLAEVFRFLDD